MHADLNVRLLLRLPVHALSSQVRMHDTIILSRRALPSFRMPSSPRSAREMRPTQRKKAKTDDVVAVEDEASTATMSLRLSE